MLNAKVLGKIITLYRDSTTQVKTVCERELSALILVEPVLLFDNPCNNVHVSLLPEYCKIILTFQF